MENFTDIDQIEFAEMYPVAANVEFSPMRKLALAVLRQAVYQANHERRVAWTGPINGIAGDASAWLLRWELVEPWCRLAEIPIPRMRRRIEEICLPAIGVREPQEVRAAA